MLDRVQRRLFCDPWLDIQINNYIEEMEDDIDYITECNIPSDYKLIKMLITHGAAIIEKDNKKSFIANGTIIDIRPSEMSTFNKIFDNPNTKVFQYDMYPTFVIKVDDKYYIKYDKNEDICELVKFNN